MEQRIHRLRVATPHTGIASLPGCSATQFQGHSTPCTVTTLQGDDMDMDMHAESLELPCADSQELSPQVEVKESVITKFYILATTQMKIIIISTKVTIPYKSGLQKFKIRTPSRKKCVKGLARRSYYSTATILVTSPAMLKADTKKLAFKIKAEMKHISSVHTILS